MKSILGIILFTFIYFVNWTGIKTLRVVGEELSLISCRFYNSSHNEINTTSCYYIQECPYKKFKNSEFSIHAKNLDSLIFPKPHLIQSYNAQRECLYIKFNLQSNQNIKSKNFIFTHDIGIGEKSKISGYCAVAGEANDETCTMNIYIDRDRIPIDIDNRNPDLTTKYEQRIKIPDYDIRTPGNYTITIQMESNLDISTEYQIVLMIFGSTEPSL